MRHAKFHASDFPNYSVSEEADELGLYHSNIVACCNGRRATCGGLEWEYL